MQANNTRQIIFPTTGKTSPASRQERRELTREELEQIRHTVSETQARALAGIPFPGVRLKAGPNPFETPCETMDISELEAELIVFLRSGKREKGALTGRTERIQHGEALARLNARLREWLS